MIEGRQSLDIPDEAPEGGEAVIAEKEFTAEAEEGEAAESGTGVETPLEASEPENQQAKGEEAAEDETTETAE